MITQRPYQNVKKIIPQVPIRWEHPILFLKLSKQLMKAKVNQWGQLPKKVACVWKDNQKECLWRHSIQILRDEEMSKLFLKNQEKTV